jgi:hypothetical protein
MLSAATGRFKTSYAADAAVQRVPLARLAFWGGLAAVFLVPPRVPSPPTPSWNGSCSTSCPR